MRFLCSFIKAILIFVFLDYAFTDEIKIRADIVRTDTRRRISIFYGNVSMRIKNGIIRSNAAEYLEQEKRIIFTSDVNLKHGVREEIQGFADKAVYLIDEELLTLHGNPSISYLLETTTQTIHLTAKEMNFDLKNNIFYLYNNINTITEDISISADEGVYYLDKNLIELSGKNTQIKVIYKDTGTASADNIVLNVISRIFLFKGNVNMSYKL